jgi:glycosyltransferase involved in cell wall biosynthesis
MYRHKGVDVHVARDPVQMCALLMNLIREFEPTWTLVSEDDSFMILAAALEVAPSRVIYLARTAINLPFGPDCTVPDPTKTEILRKAAGILTVSNYMKDYWPSYGPGPFPFFGNFESGYVTLVNPCNLKGLPVFMELARRMPGVDFAAVPTWGGESAARSLLEQLPNVTILQPQEDINKIFAQTRVLLVPSLCADALPQIVVQAMVRGIPVLGSDLGGIPEAKLGVDYVLPVNQLTFEPGDGRDYVEVVPEQDTGPWQEALERLLSDAAYYDLLAADSRRAAVDFVESLGFEPFEQYLGSLSVSTTEKDAAEPAGEVSEIQKRLSDISPERRALLALRLSKKGIVTKTVPRA